VSANALVSVGLVAAVFGVVAFLLILREAWRGTVSPGTVVALALAYHAVVLLLPLLFSRDSTYGLRRSPRYHANPYVFTPPTSRYLLAPYVGPKWLDTPAAWTAFEKPRSSRVSSTTGSLIATLARRGRASLGTIAVIMAARVWPEREARARRSA
jgi:hypothetical protein